MSDEIASFVPIAGIGVVVVLVVLFVLWLVLGGSNIRKHHDARFAHGVRAQARIERAEQPGSGRTYATAVLRLHLIVMPPGGAPYAAVTGVRVKQIDMPRAQPGAMLAVRIASDNPRLVYPDVPWAEMEIVTIDRAGRGMYT